LPSQPKSRGSKKLLRANLTGTRSLATGNALVHQNFNLNPAIFCSARGGLVRCRLVGFTVRARSRDVPYLYSTLLHQIVDHCLRSVLAQGCVHGGASRRVGIALHLDDGIGGGFAGLDRIALGGTKQVTCGFVSDAGSSDITVFKVVNRVVTIVGKFSDAQGSGKTHGIGLAVAGNYLLAGFTTSKNIGAWQIQSDCTLTFLANFKTPYAIAGMRAAPNGKTLIVGYGSGVNKVDSFSLATTGLTEHGPYPATAGAAGVDITDSETKSIPSA